MAGEKETETFRVPTSKSELTRRLAQTSGEDIILVFNPETKQYTLEAVPESAPEEREIGKVPAKPFLRAVREVAFAAARGGEEPFRSILEGVLFRFDPHNLTLVAADTHRISVSRVLVSFDIKGEVVLKAEELEKACRTLFPRGRGARDAWVQLLSKPEGVEIKQLGGETGEFVSRVEGTFPDWEKLIPLPVEGVIFQRREFLEKLRGFDREEPVRFEFLKEKGIEKFRLWQKDVEGEVREEFLSVDVEGLLVSRIAFQYRYLLDLLKNVHSDVLRMELAGETKAAAFRKVPDENFIHLVMSYRVPW